MVWKSFRICASGEIRPRNQRGEAAHMELGVQIGELVEVTYIPWA